jgi:hypothetical protein
MHGETVKFGCILFVMRRTFTDFVFERYRDRIFTEYQLICLRSMRKQTRSKLLMDPVVHLRKHCTVSDSSVQFKYNWYGDVSLINLYNQTWLLKIILKHPRNFETGLSLLRFSVGLSAHPLTQKQKFYFISSMQTNTVSSVSCYIASQTEEELEI